MQLNRFLLFLVGCGGGSSLPDAPGVSIASGDCSRLGPDGTGFMLELEYGVALEEGQAVIADFVFPTAAAPVNRSDIYNCGTWSTAGTSGVDQGCEREPGQPDVAQRVFHSLAIEFPDPLSSPVNVSVTADVLAAVASTTVLDSETQTVTCN